MQAQLTLRQASNGALLARLQDPATGDRIADRDWTPKQARSARTDTAMRELVNQWLAEIGWVILPGQLDLLPDNEPVYVEQVAVDTESETSE